jgi:prevent-host-death family protein
MKTATVSKLKASLSEYLRRVKAGEEVLVTERGRPIAKLSPAPSSQTLPQHLIEMEVNYRKVFGICQDPRTLRDPS